MFKLYTAIVTIITITITITIIIIKKKKKKKNKKKNKKKLMRTLRFIRPQRVWVPRHKRTTYKLIFDVVIVL